MAENNLFFPFGVLFNKLRQFRNDLYNWGYDVINAATVFNTLTTDEQKLAMVLSNPAILKVFALQCDLFSMGKIYVYKDEEEQESDPFLDLIKSPNFFQSRSQFLWDYMFWTMMGTSYCYVSSKIIDNKPKMYFLRPHKIEWPAWLDNYRDKMIFSDQTLNKIMKSTVRYSYEDGTYDDIRIENLIVNTDLTNGIGNWWKGASRLDALYKIASNSEFSLDAKNINIRYSGKFLVGSTNDTSKIGLSDHERDDIKAKIDTNLQKVWPLKTMVEIRRFVDNYANLQLDQAYLADYFLIGNMFGIPRDVLEAYNSATYENQEKARAAHVNYCFEPKGNQFMDSFEKFFGYTDRNIVIDWSHLPFMQVFEKERAEVAEIKINSLSSLLSLGINVEQANQFLDTKFELPTVEEEITTNSDPETKAAQAALRGSVGGVNGIVLIQQGVVAGTTSYDSGLAILTIIYGFTDEQAKQLLGNPDAQSQSQQGQVGASPAGQGEAN